MSDNELREQRDIYIGTGVAFVAVSVVAMAFSTFAKTTAARRLHDDMFSCVMTAKMQFFESTNTGDKLNILTWNEKQVKWRALSICYLHGFTVLQLRGSAMCVEISRFSNILS